MTTVLNKLFSNVRSYERPQFSFFCSLFALLTFAQTLGLSGSESLFLAKIGINHLPLALIAASLLTVAGSIIYAIFVDQRRNDVYFAQMLGGSAVILVILGLLSPYYSGILYTVYCLYYLFFAVLTNHYWTFAGDYFDSLTSKRLFPLFTVGASFGGLLGGVTGEIINRVQGPVYLVIAWGLMLLASCLLILKNKRNLRKWGPLNIQESDETSLKGMISSVKYIRHSPLSKWLLLSATSMVLALFTAQYIYSNIFAQAFPQAKDLASFMNIYLVATNFLEILLELFATPFLIGRLGVACTNLVHPISTCLSFAFLGLWPNLHMAVVARINRELLENALAGPVRNLVYNALPGRVRGRMRAFLEGTVIYSGMAAAGLILYFFSGVLTTGQLALAGGFMAVLYLLMNTRVLVEYLTTLVTELKEGKLDLESVHSNILEHEANYLATMWSSILKEEDKSPSCTVIELTAILAKNNVISPLIKSSKHPCVQVRRVIAKELRFASKHPKAVLSNLLETALDEDPLVCQEALESIIHMYPGFDANKKEEPNCHIYQVFLSLMHKSTPKIQALTALHLGNVGIEHQKKMLASSDPDTVKAAAEFAVPSLKEQLIALIIKKFPGVTEKVQEQQLVIKKHENDNLIAPQNKCTNEEIAAVSLERLSKICSQVPFTEMQLTVLLALPITCMRKSVLKALSTLDTVAAVSLLASGLNSDLREIRQIAIKELSLCGNKGVEAAGNYLELSRLNTVIAAVEAIALIETGEARKVLYKEYMKVVRQAWQSSILGHFLETQKQLPSTLKLEFYRLALANSASDNLRIAYTILEKTENPTVVKSIIREIKNRKGYKADALEILSNLGNRKAGKLLVLLLEDGPIKEKFSSLPKDITIPVSLSQAQEFISSSNNRWIRFLQLPSRSKEEVMERLLVLRKIPLFSHMTFDQLEAINKKVKEVKFYKDEVVIREGDVGCELFLLVTGSVRIIKNLGTPQELLLTTLSGINYFGEMAILDDEPRSASVVVDEDATLLSLAGDNLRELVLLMPEIAFEILKVLTRRVRISEQRGSGK